MSAYVGGQPANRSSPRARVVGAVLIVVIGLLNFHIPHFVFQDPGAGGNAGYALEAGFVVNVAGAVIAAVAIARSRRWGWILGVVVTVVSLSLWLAQETVGLPGLPQAWTEPSRLVAVVIEAGYLALAGQQLSRSS